MGCEIILLFGPAREKRRELEARAKRSGHMPPNMRYLAAQAEAMLADELWMELAAQANAMAQRLAGGLEARGISLAFAPQGNEVFALLSDDQVTTLRAAGAVFYPWMGGSQRLVCSWATQPEEVDAILDVLSG
jgi:threonine aldolase